MMVLQTTGCRRGPDGRDPPAGCAEPAVRARDGRRGAGLDDAPLL
jgi:hypothetical protein